MTLLIVSEHGQQGDSPFFVIMFRIISCISPEQHSGIALRPAF
jgi:hypothetical protein